MKQYCKILATGTDVGAFASKVLKTATHHVYWTGLIYNDQGETGDTLIQSVVNRLDSGEDVAHVATELRGSFFLLIHAVDNDTKYITVDDSGNYASYWSPLGASTSFLELCRAMGVRGADLSRSAIVGLLHMGVVYFGNTLHVDIKKIASNQVIVVSASGAHAIEKPIARLCDAPVYGSLREATAPLAAAIANESVSVDITGGFDSRMLACLLKTHGVQFEASLSGWTETRDAEYGRMVAQALDVPYYFTKYDGKELVEDLEYVLERLDGMGVTVLTDHRLENLNDDRIERGVTVSLKGSGGELYKDFFWTQDFPFYRSRRTHMHRLHRMRMEFEHLTKDVLTPECFELFNQLRSKRVDELVERYRAPINTQSYDNVYFYERVQSWNSRTITSCQDPRLAIHSPLCELKLAQVGYHVPRRKRFYNQFHRDVITEVSLPAARVPTTDGTTASSMFGDVVRDTFGYARGKSKKLAKKLSQLALNRTKFEPREYSPDTKLLAVIAESPQGVAAIDTLHAAGILRPEVTYDDLAPRFRGHALSVGWTIHVLDAQ